MFNPKRKQTMPPSTPPTMTENSRKKQVNIRLSRTGRDLLAKIADRYGITHGNVIEMLLRSEAARLGIVTPKPSAHSPPPISPE